jgi:hypothetical protein
MTTLLRKILMTLLGITAALSAWGSIELLLYFGESLGGYLFLTLAEGAILGLFFGGSFGTAEGILLSDKKRSLKGGFSGAATGITAGILVMVLVQGILTALINTGLFSLKTTENLILPISRTIGWMILGGAVGSIEGIRSRSLHRTVVGVIGGLSGGFAGGAILEFIGSYRVNGFAGRGCGFLIMGGAIGLLHSLFESVNAFGVLKVLTGPIRGKEYVICMKKTVIGSSVKSAMDLNNYSGIKEKHALILSGRDEVILESLDGEIVVNEEKTDIKRLQYEDVIEIGSVKLLYLPAR